MCYAWDWADLHREFDRRGVPRIHELLGPRERRHGRRQDVADVLGVLRLFPDSGLVCRHYSSDHPLLLLPEARLPGVFVPPTDRGCPLRLQECDSPQDLGVPEPHRQTRETSQG